MTWWQLCLLFLVADRLVVLCCWACWAGWHTYQVFTSPEPALAVFFAPKRSTYTAKDLRWIQNGPTKPS